ncbi:MAG TPA: hypothetical protein DIW24_01680 [Bacteroidetes bacterium]|nr:hypothetical protein [Bacteroidota bacterium]HRR08132.1 hypothetical protein [Rhodothermales bacterium]
MSVQTVRERLVEQAKKRLSPNLPRLQMFGIVLITALSGFLVSFTLYRGLGLSHMGYRYPLSMLVAYGVFLFCVWQWIKYQRRKTDAYREKATKGGSSGGDWSFDMPRWGGSGGSTGSDFKPGGGSFGGGGAGGSWASGSSGISQSEAFASVEALPKTSGSGWFSGKGGSGGIGGIDLDDGAALLIIVLIVGAILAAFSYIIWAAPGILAEVFVDGVLASTLARGIREEETGHWLWTVFRKTWWILTLLLVVLGWGGLALQEAFPQAHTLAQVLLMLE